MQTAIQKAIAQTDLLRRTAEDLYKLGKGCSYNELAQHHMATIVRLQSLLPGEQKIIEDAWDNGIRVATPDGLYCQSGSDYYLTTFKSKDNG